MKAKFHTLFLCLAMVVYSTAAQAQFLEKLQKRIEERAQKRVEQKVEEKVDQAVDKTIDAPEKALKETKNNNKTQKKSPAINLNALMNSSESIEMPASFDFQKKVVYEVTDDQSKQVQQLTYWFGKDEQIFGIETGYDLHTFIIYDLHQEAMMMFSEKEKKVQIISLSAMGAIFESDENNANETGYTFKKVPGSKKINGYLCEKYMMSTDTMEGEFWFTKEVDVNIADFSKTFLSMAKKSNQNVPQMNAYELGFMMEMKAKDNSSKAVTEMTVIEISNTTKTIAASTYKI